MDVEGHRMLGVAECQGSLLSRYARCWWLLKIEGVAGRECRGVGVARSSRFAEEEELLGVEKQIITIMSEFH